MILDFVKDHEELYDKAYDDFNDKARNACGRASQAAATCL